MKISWAALAFLLGVTPCLMADGKDSKDSYIQKAEQEVQVWTAKLKSLQERSQRTGANTRQELDRRVKAADEKLATARKKLEDLRTSSKESWKSLREGLDAALSDVKRALRNAQSFFNKNEKAAAKTLTEPPKK